MITRYERLKEIDAMIEAADSKNKERKEYYITATRNLLKYKGDGGMRPGPTVMLMMGKRKLKAKLDKRSGDVEFSHYINKKGYIGMMMAEHFEKLYNTQIKGGCFKQIKMNLRVHKNRKAEIKK
jgi:hypothetical protein